MQSKHVLSLGLFGYLILGSLAIYFYQERTIFLDPAFILFSIVRSGDFAIQANRFGSAFTQFFPWFAVQLQAPIKWVMLFYSGGMVLYYAICFFAVQRWLKNNVLALAVLLFNTFMVSYTFWWMQIEFAQGIALSLVFLAFATQKKQWADYNPLEISAYFLLLITILYFHPLTPFVLGYLLLFGLLDENLKLPKKQFWTAAILSAIILMFKNFVLPRSPYDVQASSGLNHFKNPAQLLNLPSNADFVAYCLKDYYLLPIGLTASLIVLGVQRKWRKFALLFGAFFAYLLLVNGSFPQGFAQFHLESFYLPLSVFILLPFLFDVLPLIKKQMLQTGLLALILAVRLIHIGALHKPYSDRIALENRMLDKLEALDTKKLILSESDLPMDTLIQSWGSSFEFWLLSSLRDPGNPRSIVIDEDPSRFDWARPNNHAFFTEWDIFPYDELPKQYFNFQDTSYYQKGILR